MVTPRDVHLVVVQEMGEDFSAEGAYGGGGVDAEALDEHLYATFLDHVKRVAPSESAEGEGAEATNLTEERAVGLHE